MARRSIDLRDFAPWDAASYMLSPVAFTAAIAAGTVQTKAVPPDPNRIILQLSLTSTTGNMLFGPSPNVTSVLGMQLTTGSPFYTMTYWDHGPIVGLAWDIGATAGAGITWTAFSYSVNDWPEDGDDPTGELMRVASLKQPTVGVPPAPQANGKLSAIGYFAALLKKLRGG